MECKHCHLPVIDEFLLNVCNDTDLLENWLQQHGAIPKAKICPKCKNQCSIEKDEEKGEDLFTCHTCNLSKRKIKGTIFDDIGLTPDWLCTFIVIWLCSRHPRYYIFKTGMTMSGALANVLANALRDVLISYFAQTSEPVGGPDCIVEIEMGKVTNDGYLREEFVEGEWVFAGIDPCSGKAFLVAGEASDLDTFLYVIKKNVLPGSMICSQHLKKYKYENNEQFEAFAKDNLVTFSHHIESKARTKAWKDVRSNFTSKTVFHLGRLAEYFFRRLHPNITDRMHYFFEIVAEQYSKYV